ncbi:MAG: hypothetical protein JNN17_26235 [Verrucomicrobiaceae bacterium]|nr:hypothetical protein [Verrucomicrobiaceae bacterium]
MMPAMLSHGSIRLFAAILLVAVAWQAWRLKNEPVVTPVWSVPAATPEPERERSLFPDE